MILTKSIVLDLTKIEPNFEFELSQIFVFVCCAQNKHVLNRQIFRHKQILI